MSNTVRARREKRILHRDVIELIIYFASKEQSELPGIKRRLLAEIILASCDYLTEEEEVYLHCGNDKSWEEKVTRRLPEIIRNFGQKMHPDIKDMLLNISQFREGYNGSTSNYANAFYDLFRLYVSGGDYSTVKLPKSFKERIEKDVLTEFDSKLIRQCKEIAELMTKYIKKDLKELKTNPQK